MKIVRFHIEYEDCPEWDTALSWISSVSVNRNYQKRRKAESQRIYSNLIAAFDIETTRITEIEQSVMYLWQFAIKEVGTDEIYCITGRTWEQYKSLFMYISKTINGILPIFVHNLSFEFHNMRDTVGMYFKPDGVFCTKRRKVIKVDTTMKQEYRCSFALTRKSLKKFLDDMKVEHRKVDGFNYNERRLPWTELDTSEMAYGMHDVIGLVEAVEKLMDANNDNIYTLPLTSTGYVRRRAREAMKSYNWLQLHSMMPDLETYILCREEFRGGDTHANRYYSFQTVKNVASIDRSSSYPDVMLNCKYPMSKFTKTGVSSIEELDMLSQMGKAYLARFKFTGLRQKDVYYGCPYLPIAKGRSITGEVNDNGRLLSAKECEFTLNDIDFSIVRSEYTWDSVTISDVHKAKYGYLPTQFRELVKSLYTDKTALKGVENKELDYMLSKEMINSMYGMTAQNPVRPEVLYTPEDDKIFKLETDYDAEAKLNKYNYKAFLPYFWGCWVTAHARYKLKQMVNIVGDYFVYCDTDSVKYILPEDAQERERISLRIAELNAQLRELSEGSGAKATDSKGVVHYMGVYEDEGVYSEFKTLGAKKYAYIKDNKLSVTISGVNKSEGAKELAAAGGLPALRLGMSFRTAGGSEAVYNDKPYGNYEIDGHTIYITSNMVIRPSTYTVGATKEYLSLIENNEFWEDFLLTISHKYGNI